MITISIVGPESTGKTDLAKALASHYKTDWVPEFAREYLNDLERPYDFNDLSEIAKGQARAQNEALKKGKNPVIFDTDLLVVKVWSQFKYGKLDPFISAQLALQRSDIYILTYFDIPYEEDPLRENPNQIPELFDVYKRELDVMNAEYIVVQGDRQKRLDTAISLINNLL